jgi:soluble lytic murein transglycosylase
MSPLALFLALTLLPSLGCAAEPPPTAPAPPAAPAAAPVPDTVDVPAELREMAISLPPDVLSALRSGQWSAAADRIAKLPPAAAGQAPDRAFVHAWALVQAKRGAEVAPLLPEVEKAAAAPRPYVDLIRGEAFRTSKHLDDALLAYAAVPEGSFAWGRAQVARAQALTELGRKDEARTVLARAAERPDPAPSGADALVALADLQGTPGEAYPLLRRVWREYPQVDVAARLAAFGADPKWQPTWKDAARRGERQGARSAWTAALADTLPFVGHVADPGSVDWCRFALVRGRAFYKLNQLSNAVTALGDMGARCTEGKSADYGAPGLYLQGTAEFRRKQYASSVEKLTLLATKYTDNTMADDGYLHAGISLQEAGDLAGAQALWRKELEAFPAGDTAPEATWRLAWSLYLQGKPDEAIATADALGKLPVLADAVSVAAGRDWAARWRLFPDVAAPSKAVADPARRQAAIDGWVSVCRDLPHNFYAIEAYSRLMEVAPEAAAAIASRPVDHLTGEDAVDWTVRKSLFDDPAIRDGVALARVGLVADAEAAWDSAAIPDEDRTPDEVAWLYELRIHADDWLSVHDEWRTWLRSHAIESLGEHADRITRLAYPDRYWKEVQAAVVPSYAIESRYFHALTREESNFNAGIVSKAGAVGLSQLMPATAQQTAGWLGLKVSTADLDDPAVNAKIGARYLDAMVKQHGGNPFLALAAYNAGGGRTKEWRTAWGDLPTDEFVERIPFRETRDYVKRVMGTWQTYRWQFDTSQSPFPDLSKYDEHCWPGFAG